MQPQTDMRQFDEAVRFFIEKDNGVFIVLSNDLNFLRNFRTAMFKHLVLPPTCVHFVSESKKAVEEIASARKRKLKVLLVIEREINGISNVEFIKYLKSDLPDIKIIILTVEIERERLVLLHELGTDSCITKPISINTIIEKIASIVKPQGKFGQMIEAGKKHLRDDAPQKALDIADKLLQVKPKSPSVLILRGDALKALGRRDEALLAYEAASRAGRLFLDPIKKLAEFHKEEGAPEKELDCLEKLDRLSPLNIERKVNMGGLNIKLGNADKAQKIFDDAVKISNRQAMGFVSDVSRSIAEMCSSQAPELAEKYLRASLEAKKDQLTRADVETFNALGISLRRQGKWRSAVKEYTAALEIAPDDENLHYNLAMAYMDGDKVDSAADELGLTLKMNPAFGRHSPVISFNLGYILMRAAKTSQACEYFRHVLKLQPDNEKARSMLQSMGQSA